MKQKTAMILAGVLLAFVLAAAGCSNNVDNGAVAREFRGIYTVPKDGNPGEVSSGGAAFTSIQLDADSWTINSETTPEISTRDGGKFISTFGGVSVTYTWAYVYRDETKIGLAYYNSAGTGILALGSRTEGAVTGLALIAVVGGSQSPKFDGTAIPPYPHFSGEK